MATIAPRVVETQLEPHRTIGFAAHLAFFDTDHDQQISLQETRRGLERLGLGRLVSTPGALVIHAGVAGLGLLRANYQNPTRLSLSGTSFVRHPDTHLVDAAGDFDAAQLDLVFERYARAFPREALTLSELLVMTGARVARHGVHDAQDALLLPGGVGAAVLEWIALWWMAGEFREGKRVLTHAAVLRFYTDPRFFEDVAKHVAVQREERAERLLGRVRNLVQAWVA